MPATDRAAPSPRVRRCVTHGYVVLFLALAGVGLPFVLDNAATYPGRVLVPTLLIVMGFVTIAVTPSAWWGRLSPRLRAGPSWLRAVALAAALLLGLHFAHHTPDSFVSVLLYLLLPGVLVLAWSRVWDRVQPMLLMLPVLGAGVVLFAFQVGQRQVVRPRASWGDPTIFATLMPTAAPYIGPGGRLRPNVDVLMSSKERSQGARIITNSNGFRNAEQVTPTPAPGELRVLSLGDSMSIGMQIDQDEFFGARLEAALGTALAPRQVTVLNAEISDPAYGLFYLQRHGLGYRPSLVIFGLCGNDMMQAEDFCGPDKRFHLLPTGQIAPNPDFNPKLPRAVSRYRDFAYPAVSTRALADADIGPVHRELSKNLDKLARSARKVMRKFGEFRLVRALGAGLGRRSRPALMYSYAHAFEREDGRMRLIDGTANLGGFYKAESAVVQRMFTRLFEILAAMDRSAREAGSRLVVVLHPQRFQVNPADWAVIRDYWNLDEADFDLGRPNRRIAAFCEQRDIVCIDLVPALVAARDTAPLYLPDGDMHYSRAGHAVAADTVAAELLRLDLR